MAKPLVIVFARAPRYGTVKSRLARDIGALEALRFYRMVLGRLMRRMSRDVRFDTVVAMTPDLQGIGPHGVRCVGQGSGDLGARMIRALRSAGRRPAVVIGSDIPDLTPRHVAYAFDALKSASVVLGPARDGGYWLIGARNSAELAPRALAGVRWSSRHALNDTLERLRDAHVLDTVLDDVDDGAAYRRVVGRV